MKKLNLLFGLSLILTMALSLIAPMTAEAEEYTYKVSIVLGGTDEVGATFVDDMRDSLTIVSSSDFSVTSIGDKVTIEGLNYNDQISFNPKSAVEVKDDVLNKYYVKGMRVSGSNDVVSESTFKVTKDNSYVIAYGVGAVIPYTVKYQDEAGNALAEADTFYGALGDEVYVPYRFIDGYVPNALNIHADSLQANQEFVFVYTKSNGSGTIYNSSTVTSYGTVEGGKQLVYQTVQVPAGEAVINNRQPGEGGNAQGQNQGNANQGEGQAADETTIADTQTPTTIEDDVEDVVEIEEEDVAKAIDSQVIYDTYKRYAFIVALIGSFLVLTTIGATIKEKHDNKKNN